MSTTAVLNLPSPARVKADAVGRPLAVNGLRVESVRESWLVEDRWWTGQPLRRRYWELLAADGRNLVVFRDLLVAGGRGVRGEPRGGGGSGDRGGVLSGGGGARGGGAVGGWFTQRD